MEMMGALETVAHTRMITRMGEEVLTDVIELCTVLMARQESGDDYCQQQPSPSQPGDEGPQEEKAVPTACMQGCPDLYPGHHKVGELQKEKVNIHKLITELHEDREQERRTEIAREAQGGDHQEERGVMGQAEDGLTSIQAGREEAKKERKEQPSTPSSAPR